MQEAESQTQPVDENRYPDEESSQISAALYSRLAAITQTQSFAMVESASGSGLEAWSLLSQRYNSTMHVKCVGLMTLGHKQFHDEDVFNGLDWESLVATLGSGRDHRDSVVPF